MLRIAAVLGCFALSPLPAPPSAEPDPFGPIWQARGVTLLRTACTPSDIDPRYCRAIALRDSARTRILGTGYMHVRLLWRRHGRGAGPDALVIGDYGGSGGNGDVFAVTVRASSTVAKYRGERLDGVRAERQAALHLNFPLDIEYFNGAPHAGAAIVPIPTAWKDGNFAADLPALVRPIPKQELGFRELAVEEELRSWAEESYPASRLYPPQARTGTLITVQALTELMLSGHADEAKALLSRSWPTSFSRSDVKLGGEEDFWRDLCRRVVEHPLWKRLGLSRLPHADVIRAGAR